MAFVVRSFPRSGTHMLRTALDSHPDITCHSEVFNGHWNPVAEIVSRGVEGLLDRYTGPLTGFVVHAHTGDPPTREDLRCDLWQSLRRRRMPMIVLEREDKLRQAVSIQMAVKTNRWMIDHHDAPLPTTEQLTVDVPALRRWIAEVEQSERDSRDWFPWACFTTYEKLLGDWSAETTRLLEYLGAAPHPLRAATQKQDDRPLREIVVNHDDLSHWPK